MYHTQYPFFELYELLHQYRRNDAYVDVLVPWLANNRHQVDWLAEFGERTSRDWAAATNEDLCRLYAVFRVTSTLLLRFQSGRADGTDYQGPKITMEDFQRFHEELGFSIIDFDNFHPFFHEVIRVIQSPVADSSTQLADYDWPCLMLGSMMYCRAGVTIEAGTTYIDKHVAESSKLYWTYRRKDRPYNDLSQGWGHNSQWRTALRRDYRTPDRYHFNVDGRFSLNDPTTVIDDLPRESMIELVRHRCMVRTRVDDHDLFPYNYSYNESVFETL